MKVKVTVTQCPFFIAALRSKCDYVGFSCAQCLFVCLFVCVCVPCPQIELLKIHILTDFHFSPTERLCRLLNSPKQGRLYRKLFGQKNLNSALHAMQLSFHPVVALVSSKDLSFLMSDQNQIWYALCRFSFEFHKNQISHDVIVTSIYFSLNNCV